MSESIMPDNLKDLLRQTFACDTKAGYKLRYHITKALAREDYAQKIFFGSLMSHLMYLFSWMRTSEGYKYWRRISDLIEDRKKQ